MGRSMDVSAEEILGEALGVPPLFVEAAKGDTDTGVIVIHKGMRIKTLTIDELIENMEEQSAE